MSDSPANKLISTRGNKAIAIILSSKEELCDPHISQESAATMRKIILDQINDLVEFALDLSNTSGDTIYNDEYMRRKIDAIYSEVVPNGNSV